MHELKLDLLWYLFGIAFLYLILQSNALALFVVTEYFAYKII